jgi:hypothetical protein
MPIWLITLLGQALLKVGLYFLEKKWPGITPVLSTIVTHVDSQPNSAVAVQNVSAHLNAMPGLKK